jgi:hypothetical protein
VKSLHERVTATLSPALDERGVREMVVDFKLVYDVYVYDVILRFKIASILSLNIRSNTFVVAAFDSRTKLHEISQALSNKNISQALSKFTSTKNSEPLLHFEPRRRFVAAVVWDYSACVG